MIIQFDNFRLALNEILNKDFRISDFTGIEFNVLKLISEWFSYQDTFVFKTSGSTGKSKEILIHRKMIEYSTNATFERIDPTRKISDSLLCLDPQFIGGAMVVFRALIMNHDIKVIEPSKNPLKDLDEKKKYGITSMVPLQYMNSSIERINQINTIIIGGSPIETELHPQIKSNVYSSYGMTETISHVALRKLEDTIFTATGDAVFSLGEESSLNISGSITNHQLLNTNDVVELVSKTSFKWIGRKDFVINSGGIKINPENIERRISNQIDAPFIVSSQEDKYLGQRVVLVIEKINEIQIDFSEFSKYEVPKHTYFISEIPRTISGKIDRIGTKKMIAGMVKGS